jgi:hypothetical protein
VNSGEEDNGQTKILVPTPPSADETAKSAAAPPTETRTPVKQADTVVVPIADNLAGGQSPSRDWLSLGVAIFAAIVALSGVDMRQDGQTGSLQKRISWLKKTTSSAKRRTGLARGR